MKLQDYKISLGLKRNRYPDNKCCPNGSPVNKENDPKYSEEEKNKANSNNGTIAIIFRSGKNCFLLLYRRSRHPTGIEVCTLDSLMWQHCLETVLHREHHQLASTVVKVQWRWLYLASLVLFPYIYTNSTRCVTHFWRGYIPPPKYIKMV